MRQQYIIIYITDIYYTFRWLVWDFTALGQFFHLKYVVIYGFVSWFALIDNMQPPSGPVCISRIALYSKIWRSFDRGLYDFFKYYIYVPIAGPTFSITKKLLGLSVSYAFVFLWHGGSKNVQIWIALNLAEIFTETFALCFYESTLKQFLNAYRIPSNYCISLNNYALSQFSIQIFGN